MSYELFFCVKYEVICNLYLVNGLSMESNVSYVLYEVCYDVLGFFVHCSELWYKGIRHG